MKIGRRITVMLVLVLALVLGLIPAPVVADPGPYQYGDVFAAVSIGRVNRYDSAGNYIDLDFPYQTGCIGIFLW